MKKLRKRLQRAREFATALFRGYAYFRRNWDVSYWAMLKHLVNALRRHPRVPWSVYRARIQFGCHQCHLYDHKRRVCGNDGPMIEDINYHPVPRGCRCWIVRKAWCANTTCYLEEIGLESGWEQ